MEPSRPRTLGDLSWHVARACNAGTCIAVATNGHEFFIGDTKSPKGPALAYSRDEWLTFVDGVKRGDFDHLS
jgi:hypothetical protein